ncbi:hypothetical protein ACVW16_005973 [Bradyrhizobium sp. USDA 4474]
MRLFQRLAIPVLGIHQIRDEIVGRLRSALLDMGPEIVAHLLHGLQQHVLVLDAELQDHVDPVDEEVAVALGNAEHVRDGLNRDVFAIARGGVDLAIGDEAVDQLVADRAHPRFQFLHRVRRERRQQQLLGRFVHGRIGSDRRRRVSRDFGPDVADDDAARRKMLGVVGDFAHRFIGRRHIAAEKAPGMHDRARGAQLLPDREGIVGPLRVGVVEIVDPVGHGRMGGRLADVGHL